MFAIGSVELLLILVVLLVVAGFAVWMGTRQRERIDISELPVLLQVADWSGPNPGCPTCKSVSFHPVSPRNHSMFLLVLGIFAFGTSSEGVQPRVIACTACGRQFRQR